MGGWLALITQNWATVTKFVAVVVFGLLRLLLGWKSRSLDHARDERDDLASYKKTREVIDDATAGTDPDDARSWLRDRGNKDAP
jgi:hypothetical protein